MISTKRNIWMDRYTAHAHTHTHTHTETHILRRQNLKMKC
jgi:hypothetical protein